jgi:hypothetical protein
MQYMENKRATNNSNRAELIYTKMKKVLLIKQFIILRLSSPTQTLILTLTKIVPSDRGTAAESSVESIQTVILPKFFIYRK